jgi:hypothetical protein
MNKSNNLIQRLGQGEILAGISGLALLILLLFPWFSWVNTGMVISDASGSHSPQGTMTIWQATPIVGYILLFLGVVAAGIAGFKVIRRANLPTWASMLLIALGIISAGLMLKSVISPPTEVDLGGIVMLNNVQVTPAIGLWLGFVTATGVICGGLLIMRHRKNPISD